MPHEYAPDNEPIGEAEITELEAKVCELCSKPAFAPFVPDSFDVFQANFERIRPGLSEELQRDAYREFVKLFNEKQQVELETAWAVYELEGRTIWLECMYNALENTPLEVTIKVTEWEETDPPYYVFKTREYSTAGFSEGNTPYYREGREARDDSGRIVIDATGRIAKSSQHAVNYASHFIAHYLSRQADPTFTQADYAEVKALLEQLRPEFLVMKMRNSDDEESDLPPHLLS